MLRLPVEAFSAVFTKYPESLVRVVQVSGRFTSFYDPRPSQAPGGWTQLPRGAHDGLINSEQPDLANSSSEPPPPHLPRLLPPDCGFLPGSHGPAQPLPALILTSDLSSISFSPSMAPPPSARSPLSPGAHPLSPWPPPLRTTPLKIIMVRLQRVTFLALHNYLGLTNELFSHVSCLQSTRSWRGE